MIPGSDILDEAFGCIDTNTIQYIKYIDRTLNDVGQWVSTYQAPIDFEASVQAVNRKTYNQLGLDFQKNYINVFFSVNAVDLDRGVTGDRVQINQKLYQIENLSDWYAMDGWVEALCVEVNYL
jgi:hypothetical protein